MAMLCKLQLNFAKAIAIQSPESVTLQNTPQVKILSSRDKFFASNSDLPIRISCKTVQENIIKN